MWRRKAPGSPVKAEIAMRPAPIVGDASISIGSVGEGRMIPLVILDGVARPDIAEFIRVHSQTGPGDVKSQWGTLHGSKDTVSLLLDFTNPVEVSARLDFEIVRQGVLVEQILYTKSLYLQAGKAGDRISMTWAAPRIIIEVLDTGFRPTWDYLFERQVRADYRRRGLSRQEAKQAAKAAIQELREFGSVRTHRKGTRDVLFRFD
jgi:hypothetical protein